MHVHQVNLEEINNIYVCLNEDTLRIGISIGISVFFISLEIKINAWVSQQDLQRKF